MGLVTDLHTTSTLATVAAQALAAASGRTASVPLAPVPAASGAKATHLVLFVGATSPPDPAWMAAFARQGMRGLWLGTLEQALQATKLAVFDAAVLHTEGCGEEGTTSCLTQLRRQLPCPLLVVAQQADEIDEIVALELGADGYLVWPLAPRRLIAHLRAAFRRQPGVGPTSVPGPAPARFEDWSLQRSSGVLQGPGRRIELTEVQSRLLQVMMDAAGLAVPRTALLAALPRSTALATRSVDVYVSRLRLRLQHEGVHGLHVHMVRGCGYALQGASSAAARGAAAVQRPLRERELEPVTAMA